MKIFISVFLLVIVNDLHACKADLSEVYRLSNNPNNAPTVFFGIIVRKNEEKKLIPIKPWPKGEVKIEHVELLPCMSLVPQISDDKKYFFISSNRIEEFSEGKVKATKANSGLVGMSEIPQLLQHLTIVDEFPIGKPNMFWSYCNYDDACTITKNSCGENFGVNRKYKSRYDNYIKDKKCTNKSLKNNNESKVSKCVDYFCS